MNGMLDLSLLALLKAEKMAAKRWPKPVSGWRAAWRRFRRWFK